VASPLGQGRANKLLGRLPLAAAGDVPLRHNDRAIPLVDDRKNHSVEVVIHMDGGFR